MPSSRARARALALAPARAAPAVLVALLALAPSAAAALAPPGTVASGTVAPGPGAPQPAASPADPAGRVTWTIQPASPAGADGRVSLRHLLDPGATAADHVVVSNLGDAPATFLVQVGDGTVSPAGDFDVLPADEEPHDGGAWVVLGDVEGAQRLGPGRLRLTLPAASAVTVPLRIAVPADARPGDHPAGVVAELVDDAASGVRFAARVGVRVHLRVAGEVAARLVPEDVRARWEPSWNPFAPGTVHVTYRVVNAGDVRLGARTSASLAGPFGAGAAARAADRREVLPDGSADVAVAVPAWPLVRTGVRVHVAPAVVGEDVVDAPLRAEAVTLAVWTPPWSQLALVASAGGAAVAVRESRRRSARRVQARIDAAVAAATAAGAAPGTAAPPTAPCAAAPSGAGGAGARTAGPGSGPTPAVPEG